MRTPFVMRLERIAASFFVIHAIAAQANAWAETRVFEVSRIHPTQMEISVEVVRGDMRGYLKKGNGDPAAALRILGATVVPAVVAPDGSAWITDGHHRTSAARLLGEKHGIKATLTLDLLADFSLAGDNAAGWRSFYQWLEASGRLFFTPEVRKSSVPFSEKVSKLPATMSELLAHDNPMRGVTGIVLEDLLGTKGEEYIDYIEFYLAEQLEASGMKIVSGQERDPKVLDEAARKILSPEGVRFLKASARSEKWQAVLEQRVGAAVAKLESCSQSVFE